MRILLSRAPYIAHCSLRRAHTARAAVPGLRPSQRRPSAGSTALRRAPSAGQCRPSAGPSATSAGLRPALPCPSAGRAGLRPGTPCPSAGQCRPTAGHSVPSAGLRPALRSPNAGQCRPSAFGRHSVPLVQTSAGLASVSPMPRVTECTCRPVPHCRCRPSGLHQALVTYRV